MPGLQTQSSLATPLSPLNLLGVVAGQGGATGPVRVAGQLALAVALVVLAVRTARGAAWLQAAGWATLALVLSLPWVMPWYVVWVLPLAVLSPSRRLRRATLALTVFLLVSFIPVTGYLLEACGCSPADTQTGKRERCRDPPLPALRARPATGARRRRAGPRPWPCSPSSR